MYKYGIIGFGGLGKAHLSNLIKLEKERGDIMLQAVCGADPNAFKDNVKINLGNVDISNIDFSQCHFYQDYKEMLDKEQLDFVLSTLPTYLHEEVAVYALNKGIHVFSEKPMALSLESCDNMIAAAQKNKKYLMIGQCLRFMPNYVKLKEYVDTGVYGKPLWAEFTRYSQKPTWTWNNWILDPKLSGGCILDMHIHDVDMIKWLFGMPKSLSTVVAGDKEKRETVFTRYFYDDLLVCASADWTMKHSFPFSGRCLVNFERATVVITDANIKVFCDDESFSPEICPESDLMQEMRGFLGVILDGQECTATSPESVRDSIWLAMQEVESGNNNGKTVICK